MTKLQIFAARFVGPLMGASVVLTLLLGTKPAAAQIFAPPVTLPIDGNGSIVLADFNSDGILDLADTYPGYYTYSGSGATGGIEVALGSGNGVFMNFIKYSANTQSHQGLGGSDGPFNLTLGDFNNDGLLDIIAPMSSGFVISPGSSGGTPFNGTTIAVFGGYGEGGFSMGDLYPVGDTPTAVAVADFNNDGISDVVVTNASGILTIYYGIGMGLFEGGLVYSVGFNPSAIHIADLNRDGRPDLLTVNRSDGSVSVLLNSGNGNFQKPRSIVLGSNLKDVALGDLNGDGLPDMIALRSGELDTLIQHLDGTFTLDKVIPLITMATALLVNDFDGDGIVDVLTNQLEFIPHLGTFRAANLLPVAASGNMACADLDGDGKLDVIVGRKLYINNKTATQTMQINLTVTLDSVDSDTYSPYTAVVAYSNATGAAIVTSGPVNRVGTFILPNLPADSYTLKVSASNFLYHNVSVSGTAGSIVSGSVTLLNGDVNQDNKVDIADFGLLINAYGGSVLVDSQYNRYDLNGDGAVDMGDFAIIVNNYGLQGDL